MTIKVAREKAGLTQAQLAEKIGVQQAAVARWENGGRHPKYDTLVKIAGACNIDASELLPGHSRKIGKAEALFGIGLTQTCGEIFSQINAKLIDTCTAEQLAEIAKAINAAYHAGKASMGAEVVDGDYLWVDCLNKGFEISDLRRIKVEENTEKVVKHYDGNLCDDYTYTNNGNSKVGRDIGNSCSRDTWQEWTRTENMVHRKISIDNSQKP